MEEFLKLNPGRMILFLKKPLSKFLDKFKEESLGSFAGISEGIYGFSKGF